MGRPETRRAISAGLALLTLEAAFALLVIYAAEGTGRRPSRAVVALAPESRVQMADAGQPRPTARVTVPILVLTSPPPPLGPIAELAPRPLPPPTDRLPRSALVMAEPALLRPEPDPLPPAALALVEDGAVPPLAELDQPPAASFPEFDEAIPTAQAALDPAPAGFDSGREIEIAQTPDPDSLRKQVSAPVIAESTPAPRRTDQLATLPLRPLEDRAPRRWASADMMERPRAAILAEPARLARADTDILFAKFDLIAIFAGRDLAGPPRRVSLPAGLAQNVGRLGELFQQLDYTLQNGAVPSVFVPRLPGDMSALAGSDARKAMFLRALLPHILHVNERALWTRRRLIELAPALEADEAIAPADRVFVRDTLLEYRLTRWNLAELLVRVDAVPPSLALAQAAEESGWGTSRMARDENALFGEVMFERGAKPRQRPFDNLADGVEAYIRNLNTHTAYSEFRLRRAQMRAAGRVPDGHALAGTIERYSERGSHYVATLRNLMALNNLSSYDTARFRRPEEAPAEPVPEEEEAGTLN